MGVNVIQSQESVCSKFGSAFVPVDPHSRVGIALSTLSAEPLNALRIRPEEGTCGWYIWGGEVVTSQDDFFQPLHSIHLAVRCPAIIPYLGLAPGWRVLLAPTQVDVWFDERLVGE